MTTLTDVFKMFPMQMTRNSKSENRIKKKSKSIKSCFSEGLQDGCEAFTKTMGHPSKKKL